MDSALMLGARFGLLILLWLFIFVVLAAQRRDIKAAELGVRRATSGAAPVRGASKREKAREVVVVEGPLQGSYMEVASVEALTLGRADDNDFVLGDDFASSRHARLFRRGSDCSWRTWIRATAPLWMATALTSLNASRWALTSRWGARL